MKVSFGLGIALVAALLVPAAAYAQDKPQVKVQVDDLDLTKDAGVKTANNRLKGGVERQCTQTGQDLHSIQDYNACKKDLLTKGHAKIAAAAAKSDADKLAEERHLAEVSIHPRRIRRASSYTMTRGQVVVLPNGRHVVRHRVIRRRHVVHHRVVKHPRHPVRVGKSGGHGG